MSTVEMMKSQANQLSADERAELAHHLLSTLDDPDSRSTEQWETDLARRVAEIRDGTAKGRNVDEVMRDLEKRFP